MYTPVKVDVPSKFHDKIKKMVEQDKKMISVPVSSEIGNDTLLLTSGQITKLERARLMDKKKIIIRMSAYQAKQNLTHEGGFLGMLIAALSAALPSIVSAATAAAPAVLASAATGAISGAISKAVSGDGLESIGNGLYLSPHPLSHGDGLYIKRNGLSAKIEPVDGNGLYLAPHPLSRGDGLFLSKGGHMHEIKDIEKMKSKVPMIELII